MLRRQTVAAISVIDARKFTDYDRFDNSRKSDRFSGSSAQKAAGNKYEQMVRLAIVSIKSLLPLPSIRASDPAGLEDSRTYTANFLDKKMVYKKMGGKLLRETKSENSSA